MTNFYIGAAWVFTFGVVGAYAASLMVRGRRLSRAVPAGSRRWMANSTKDASDSNDAPANQVRTMNV